MPIEFDEMNKSLNKITVINFTTRRQFIRSSALSTAGIITGFRALSSASNSRIRFVFIEIGNRGF